MKLRLSPRGRQDIGEIGRYLRPRNPAAALRVRDAIRDSLTTLTTYPYAERAIGGGLHRFFVPRLPYLIFYRVDEAAAAVLVVTIRHSARAPFQE